MAGGGGQGEDRNGKKKKVRLGKLPRQQGAFEEVGFSV